MSSRETWWRGVRRVRTGNDLKIDICCDDDHCQRELKEIIPEGILFDSNSHIKEYYRITEKYYPINQNSSFVDCMIADRRSVPRA